MPELNASIRHIPLPARLARRPVNKRGFPVPWFVSWRNGDWDFVNLDPRNIGEAYRRKVCWLCGEPLGRFMAFVIGPMCSINRISSEPPSHRECAEYAVRACPFLARPNAKRNEAASVNHGETVPGIMIEHNPEASLIWITKSYKPMNTPKGALFQVGDPVETFWFKEGRPATRAEVLASIDKGLPYLRKVAAMEDAEDELDRYIGKAMKLLPA